MKAKTVARATVPADDDGLGALYDLAEQAETAPPPVDSTRCPQCRGELEEDAVICTNCGYNTRTGKALSTANESLPTRSNAAVGTKKPKQPIDLMAPQGSFIAGLAMSAAFALAASVLWIVVAWLTGFAIGYIAILIGGAAGIGMRVGHKGFSRSGGIAAAATTLLAIMVAKVIVVEILLSRLGYTKSIFDLNSAKLGYYFFNPLSLIIIAIGMGAAFRTANGSVSD